MLITIRNGKAELRNDNGGLVRTMGSSNVVSVSMSADLELVGIVYANGKAEIRRRQGYPPRCRMVSKEPVGNFPGIID